MRIWFVVALAISPLLGCESGDGGGGASEGGESTPSAGQTGPRVRRAPSEGELVDASTTDEASGEGRCRPGTEGCACIGGTACQGGLQCRARVCLPGAAPSPAGPAQSTGSAGSQQRKQSSQPVPSH